MGGLPYEALAPALPHLTFPMVRRTRIVQGHPFFRMQEVEGEPNSETRIEVLSMDGEIWRYALFPVTGRKHQLRVQMAGLGAPLLNDQIYASAGPDNGNFDRPLRVLAQSLKFIDPLSGKSHELSSRL